MPAWARSFFNLAISLSWASMITWDLAENLEPLEILSILPSLTILKEVVVVVVRLPPVDGSGNVKIDDSFRYQPIKANVFTIVRCRCRDETKRDVDVEMTQQLFSMRRRMTQHFFNTVDDTTLLICRFFEHVFWTCFWTCQIHKIFDAGMISRLPGLQNYHFRPDWPTGTLRVEFTRFA